MTIRMTKDDFQMMMDMLNEAISLMMMKKAQNQKYTEEMLKQPTPESFSTEKFYPFMEKILTQAEQQKFVLKENAKLKMISQCTPLVMLR